jgi:hypothetical protein
LFVRHFKIIVPFLSDTVSHERSALIIIIFILCGMYAFVFAS